MHRRNRPIALPDRGRLRRLRALKMAKRQVRAAITAEALRQLRAAA